MPNYSPLQLNKGLPVDPYINVEEIKDKQGRVLFRFIRFNLNKESLKTILQARSRGQRLHIASNLLTHLRYCALSDGEHRYNASRIQSGLTFCTYYQAQMEAEKIVMRSVISPDGDIMHQIRRDCFDYPNRCRAIATAHHWILEQLLNQLGIRETKLLTWLSWALSLPIVALIVVFYAVIFKSINPLILLAAAVMLLLLQTSLKRLLPLWLPQLKAWLFHQLLFGLLCGNSLKKKIAKGLWGRFVP